MPAAKGRRLGCTLLNWTTNESSALLPKPKHTFLPLLIVLFLVSYGLMAYLVTEQGRTIESQRNLIQQLFTDSSQLSAMKGKAFQKQRAEAQARAQAQGNAHSQAQAPSTQDAPRDHAKSDHPKGKIRKPAPEKPPTDTSDSDDERRILISI